MWNSLQVINYSDTIRLKRKKKIFDATRSLLKLINAEGEVDKKEK